MHRIRTSGFTGAFWLLLSAIIYFCPLTTMPVIPDRKLTLLQMQNWGMDRGLPSNSIYTIRQTRNGYLWIGTHDGLVRFDGNRFEVYSSRRIPQLNNNTIRALCEDQSGILWIGTDSGGLIRYKNEQFFAYTTEQYYHLGKITAIEEDRWGNLWIGSYKYGLACLKKEEFSLYTSENGLPANRVCSIYKDTKNTLWITTPKGIAELTEPGSFRIKVSQEQLPYYITNASHEAENGILWIGTGDRGFFRLEGLQLTHLGAKAGIPHTSISTLYLDNRNSLWIGTDGGGLVRMNNGRPDSLSVDDGLSSGSVYSIFEDNEGSIWVGTLDGGLHQLQYTLFTSYTTKEGLAHDNVRSIDQLGDDELWFCTDKGLNRFDKGRLTTVLTNRGKSINTPFVSILEDRNAYIWLCTWGALYRFKKGNFDAPVKMEGLSSAQISCISMDSSDNIWIGTQNGLNLFNPRDNSFSYFTKKDGLTNDEIKMIFEDSRNRLWIGTVAGLVGMQYLKVIPGMAPSGTESLHFRCAYEDKSRSIWFGTDGGIVLLKSGKSTLITEQNGLNENYVYTILEDDFGYLWLGGRNGISRIRKQELEDFADGKIERVSPITYDESDGMKSRWCTGSGVRTRDGRLWFPTSVGVTTVNPADALKPPPTPPLIIEKIIADGTPHYIHAGANGSKDLELEPGKQRLEFFYTAPSFLKPEKIQFKLKLKGYDRDWLDMGNSRNTTYTGLVPGHYTFSVTARNPGGAWNQKGASLNIYLKPFFFQTLWFYLVVALVLLTAVLAAHRLRVRGLKAREKELSMLVGLRTRELQRSNRIIEEKNHQILDSISYASRIQKAILQFNRQIDHRFPGHFILFFPRDVVSGDFYWFTQCEGKYFLVVADCTGHGVPGALLSMIGLMELNDIINKDKITDPALILFNLHNGFRDMLHSAETSVGTLDGMDAAVCCIDPKKKKLIFAGAKRPLLMTVERKHHSHMVEQVRQTAKEGWKYTMNDRSILFDIKGSRKSIGGRQKEKQRIFKEVELDIFPGTHIYLCSDGLPDQCNEKGEKFGSRRLKACLLDHAHLDIQDQNDALMDQLINFQGNEEQRDDITLIGIKL